eukprot:8590188-Prorocentrum_lima.AAC.1
MHKRVWNNVNSCLATSDNVPCAPLYSKPRYTVEGFMVFMSLMTWFNGESMLCAVKTSNVT